MLVIDDSKLNLLKMKEKMLELAINNRDETLAEYANLAREVDKMCYQEIVEKIKNSDYNNLPLEEQFKVLKEILDEYNYYHEIRCMFKNTYSKYSDSELELTDLSNILANNLEMRVSQIEGYLTNANNLKSNKLELDRLNQKLIQAEKGKKQVHDAFKEIRDKLKNEVLNAQGRKKNTDGRLEVTTISLELKNYGINLNEIIDDQMLLDKVYMDALKEKEESQETLNTARSLPNRDDEICGMYAFEILKVNYKIILIELIKEVFNENKDYSLFKDSLYKIEDLIKEIKNNLKELKIDLVINPFDQIKIRNYIEIFEKLKDYDEDLEKVRGTITYLSEMVDDMERVNSEFLSSINDEVVIYKEDINTLYLDIPKENEEDNEIFVDIFKDGKDNQVIKIASPSEMLNIRIAKEKTASVIKRVYEMFCKPPKEETVPELVIERKPTEIVDLFQEVTPFEEPALFEERKDGEIFDINEVKDLKMNLTDDKEKNELREKIDTTSDGGEGIPFWPSREEEVEEKPLVRAKTA